MFARCGNPKGIRPFGALSWFILCRAAKNEHKDRTPNARNEVALCEAVEKSLKIQAPRCAIQHAQKSNSAFVHPSNLAKRISR